jgi:hypothetical protein
MRALIVLLFAAFAHAEPYAVGSTLVPFALEDQHGKRAEIGAGVRLLMLTRDMDAGDLVKQALAATEQRVLDERHAVYVADISGMPALVSRFIAVPRMRERPYRVLLDRDRSTTRDVPSVKGKVTVLSLDALRVTGVDHLGSVEAVKGVLGGAAGE